MGAAGVGLAVTVAWVALRPRPPTLALLAPPSELPATAVAVVAGPARFDRTDETSEALTASSWASRFCGGVDLAEGLLQAPGRDYAGIVALGLESLRAPESVREALRCGAAIAKATHAGHMMQVLFSEAGKVRLVTVVRKRSALGDTPLLLPVSFGDVQGRASREGERGSPRVAGIETNAAWIGGSYDDVAASVRGRGSSSGAASLDTLVRLAARLAPADAFELRFRPEALDVALPCTMIAPESVLGDFLSACVPATHAGDGQSLAVHAKASAVAWDRPEAGHGPRFELALWGRDADEASAAEKKLEAYAGALRIAVGSNEVQLTKMASAGARSPRELAWKAVSRSWLAAIKKGRVVRDGDLVRWVIDRPLTEDDAASLRSAVGTLAEPSARAAAAVSAVVEGKPVDVGMLTPFLGADNAGWLLAPQMRDEDCKKVTDRVNALAAQPGFEDFAFASDMLEAWEAGARCRAMRLSAASRGCLATVQTVKGMAACELTPSPDEVALRKGLQGAWSYRGLLADNAFEAQQLAHKARSSTLAVAAGAMHLAGGYDTVDGPFSFVWVRADGTRSMKAKLRVGDRRLEVTLSDRDMHLATWAPRTGQRRPALVFVRR
jgi:hypothetical protein